MASRIAGITVEIGGDTLKLKQALSEVEGKIKQTQRELKDVERLLKLDPHNTELLTQKQKLLNTAIEETKKKLETLRIAEEQAKTALANGDISEKQFDALKREIIATEQELDKFTEKLKHTDSSMQATLKEVGGKFKETGEKISSVGTTLSKNVTAPIVAVGTAATLAFREIDEGYDTIIKKTGATGESFEGLKNVADNIFKSLPVSMNDVGIAVGEVNTRFKVTGDELQELSTLFLKFAEINETDLNTAIGMTNKIMVQWGIDAKETANVLGLITQKAQDTGISVDTLMNGVQQHGAILKEMGLNLGQSINLLAQFEANGVNADQALRGFRKAVAAYTKDGLSMDEALRKTIESIKNAGSETEALTIATKIFGTKGAAEMTRAIREGRFSIDDLSKSMSEYGDVVDKTFEATEDGIDKFKVASNNAKLALGSLGEAISDVLGPILQGVATVLGGIATWLNSLSPTAKQIVVIIGLIVAAIGPLLVIIGTVIGSIGNIITGVAAISGAFSAMSGVMAGLSGAVVPILAIIAAVVTLISIGSYLKAHWSGIKDFFINL
jgi:phage tail tape measure protein, TP901 family